MSKKIVIPKEQLPEENIYTRRYEVRYRIVTEDRNRTSPWTPIYSVNPEFLYQPGTFDIVGELKIEKIGSSYVGITWDAVSIYKKENGSLINLGELASYDVWIRWAGSGGANPGPWLHKDRISTTSVNINIPSQYSYESGGSTLYDTPRYLYVEIYRPARPLERFEETRSFPQNSTTVDVTNDYLYFTTGHGTVTGTPGLYLSATPIGGFTNNTTYYTRSIDYYRVAFYPTKNDAIDDTNKINLTGTPTGTGSFTGYTFRIYNGVITTL